MGLSKKKESTNLMKLRSQLNALNVSGGAVDIQADPERKNLSNSDSQRLLGRQTGGSGATGAIIKEAKKRGRKANQLIDGTRLMTCS